MRLSGQLALLFVQLLTEARIVSCQDNRIDTKPTSRQLQAFFALNMEIISFEIASETSL